MSSLPPVLQRKVLERPVNQDVNTDLLFPVNFSQQGCKYILDKKGILSADSQLVLKQIVVNSAAPAVDTNSVLPTSTGIHSCIKRCFLEIGGRRVSDLNQLGQFMTWNKLHMSNEYKKGVMHVKEGGNDIFMGSASRNIDVNNVVSQKARGFSAPYGTLGRVSDEYANSQITSGQFGLQQDYKTDTADPPSRRITADEATSPSFSCSLASLIPILKMVNLPLAFIREEVSITIEWADNTFGHRFYPPQTDSAGNPLVATNCTSTMVEKDCFMIIDTLYFPDLMQELGSQIMSQGGYNVPYTEELVQENMLITGAADTAFNQNYQIALGGKKVKHIIVQKELVDGANESINNLGRYNSLAFRLGEDIQLNIDSANYYSQSLSNGALQKHEADMVAGPLQLCDYRYSWFNQVDANGAIAGSSRGLSNRLVNTYANENECGSMHWIGIKLENAFGEGKRMSNVPVIYTTRSKSGVGLAPDDQDTQRRIRFFVGIQKVLNISQGIVTQIE